MISNRNGQAITIKTHKMWNLNCINHRIQCLKHHKKPTLVCTKSRENSEHWWWEHHHAVHCTPYSQSILVRERWPLFSAQVQSATFTRSGQLVLQALNYFYKKWCQPLFRTYTANHFYKYSQPLLQHAKCATFSKHRLRHEIFVIITILLHFYYTFFLSSLISTHSPTNPITPKLLWETALQQTVRSRHSHGQFIHTQSRCQYVNLTWALGDTCRMKGLYAGTANHKTCQGHWSNWKAQYTAHTCDRWCCFIVMRCVWTFHQWSRLLCTCMCTLWRDSPSVPCNRQSECWNDVHHTSQSKCSLQQTEWMLKWCSSYQSIKVFPATDRVNAEMMFVIPVNQSVKYLAVMVYISAFLACHQFHSAGSSLGWGLNFGAEVCGIFWSSSSRVFSGYSSFLPSFNVSGFSQ